MKKIAIMLLLVVSAPAIVLAEEGNNAYQITLLRAHPGNLEKLILQSKSQKQKTNNQMVIMRHSQGDHWDLMLVSPLLEKLPLVHSYQQLVDFQQDFTASSKLNWKQMQALSNPTNLFHIEMFHAASGQYQALLQQREMENQYLSLTERNPNAIFETAFGSDVDLFTIGFYPDMPTFAADPNLADAVFENAAKQAGFKSRSDIGLYLRRFIVSHQDTLATQVR